MDHRQDNQLPEELRNALARYEIPYEDGRWERFAEKTKRRRRAIALKWASMAAAVLLAFLLIPLERIDTGNAPGNGHIAEARNEKAPGVTTGSNERTPSGNDSITDRVPVSASQPLYTWKAARRIPVKKQASTEAPSDTAQPTDLRASVNLQASSEQHPTREREASLTAELQTTSGRETASTKKRWNFGLEVSTAITDKAYLGGGISATYVASPKVSLQGGVGWQHLGMNRRLRQPERESDFRSLTGTETLVSGIDIPVSVSYHINDGFYAAVGVSAYIVLREEKSLVYLEKELQSVESTNPTTGEPETHYEMVEYDARYPSSDRDFLNTPLGFIQFSAGKRLPVGTGLSLTAEPYFKLPIGQANTRTGVSHGGLRLKVSF